MDEKETQEKKYKPVFVMYHDETGHEDYPVWIGRVYDFEAGDDPIHDTGLCISAMDAIAQCMIWSQKNGFYAPYPIYTGRFTKDSSRRTKEELDEFRRKYTKEN